MRNFDSNALEEQLFKHSPQAPAVSIVIPVRDEERNICPLIEEIRKEFSSHSLADYEVVVVDDGSTDQTVHRLRALAREMENLRVIRLSRASGQSAAIWAGVASSRSPWVATVDGDGQNDPADIWPIWQEARRRCKHTEAVLVVGKRAERKDAVGRLVTSWVLNRLSGACLGHGMVDKGSGLKVFRRKDFLALPRFDHMHRFLPGLFKLLDADIAAVPANHRPRRFGRSHYGNLTRIREALVDVAAIMWLQRHFMWPSYEEDS